MRTHPRRGPSPEGAATNRHLPRYLLSLFLVWAGLGCAHRPPLHPGVPECDPVAVREGFRVEWEAVERLRLETGVTLRLSGGEYPGRLVLAYRRPDRLRLDLFDPLGTLRGLVVVAGQRRQTYLPGGDRGGEWHRAVEDVLGDAEVSATPGMVAALIGGFPGGFLGGRGAEGTGPEAVAAGGEREWFRCGQAYGRAVVEHARVRRGKGGIEVRYGDFVARGGYLVPRTVILAPDTGAAWELEGGLRSLEFPPSLEEEIFAPLPPMEGLR